MVSKDNIRLRYAPSPTGYPHVGNIRTALFNWLYVRHHGGKFIVRIEDTDQERKVEGALESILESMQWLGLNWDEGPQNGGDYGPYFQSERLDLYHKHAQQLLENGHAYKCYCTPERLAEMRSDMVQRKESIRAYDRRCRDLNAEERMEAEAQGLSSVVRFKIPLEGQTTFHDLIRGDITFDNGELDDIVLLKSDGYPTYHLANIVDDHFMKISHVLRADEWLSSTPRHVLLYEAFGWDPPLFAHLPMILGPDKSKLSKRHGATSVIEFRDQGYLPEAMLNFVALLGWSLDDKTEIFSRDELMKHFSLDRISKTGAIFNHEKLLWMNGYYIRELSYEQLLQYIMPVLEKELPQEVKRPISADYVFQILPLIKERINTINEVVTYANFFFLDELEYDPPLLIGKKMTAESTLSTLKATIAKLSEIKSFDHDSLEGTLRPLAEELGLKAGQLFSPLRIACTGRTASPGLFETMAVLGKERCLKRIAAGIEKLREDELNLKLNQYPLLSHYLGTSLKQRIARDDWFENRFIRAMLTDSDWMQRHEQLLADAQLENVQNGQGIFSNLGGHDSNYDLKMFDALAEARLIRWARENGYTDIRKLVPDNTTRTAEFLMKKDGKTIIAEVKNFRARDYLLDFVYDRIGGLFLKSGLCYQFGLAIKTTRKYENSRNALVGIRRGEKDRKIMQAREALPEGLLDQLTSEQCSRITILDGLFTIERRPYIGLSTISGGSHNPPSAISRLMLSKLEGNLNSALDQMTEYLNAQSTKATISNALVFLSGTSPQEEEWATMWEMLCKFNDNSTWERVQQIRKEIEKKIAIPFELIVAMDYPLRYDYFPWTREECGDQLK